MTGAEIVARRMRALEERIERFEHWEPSYYAGDEVRIGILGDCHYGFSAGFNTTLRLHLDVFIDDMNAWGAHYVFLMGDNAYVAAGAAASQAAILELRDWLESSGGTAGTGLNCPIHPMWGNHEYHNAAWGTDWSYENWKSALPDPPWGPMVLADTWYTLELDHVVIIVLNNGYSAVDYINHEFPAAEITWLEAQLKVIDKPIIVLTHEPLSKGTGALYDYADREAEVGRLLGQYDNVMFTLFGHCHHDVYVSDLGDYPNPYFRGFQEQRAYGLRHIHTHWPNYLDPGDDISVYGKLTVWPEAEALVETSYTGEGEREKFIFKAPTRVPYETEDYYLRVPFGGVRYRTQFDSLDGFEQTTTGTGAITIDQGGVYLSTGVTAGGFCRVRKQLDLPWGYDDRMLMGWDPAIWRLYVGLYVVSDAVVLFYWGSDVNDHVGFRIENDNLYGVRKAGGAAENNKLIFAIPDGQAILLQLVYNPGMDRVDFIAGGGMTGWAAAGVQEMKKGLDLGAPAGSDRDMLRVEITSQANIEQRIALHTFEFVKGKALIIRQ